MFLIKAISILEKLRVILSDIKIQHTIFALPFAVMSAFLAAEGIPDIRSLFWIFVAMVSARSAAMAFNRIVDAKFDKANPRTQDRALPSGKALPGQYWIFLVLSAIIFIIASGMLNQLALMLSPAALAIVFFYSFTKRFTSLSHFFLGIALSVAPVGAWVAIKEEISFASLVLGAAVVFWLIGFDIIYSCQDVEVDQSSGLHSIPAKFGVRNALRLAAISHAIMIIFLLGLLFLPLLGTLYLVGVIAVAGLLVYEHSLVKWNDLSKVNVAFFNVNGWIGAALMATVVVDCVWL
jgi:4-hydroxybenzoate polyprenyltransferase